MRWIKHAWLNILRNRRRTLLTVIVTAIASSSLLLAIGFGLFTYESLKEMAVRDNGDVIMTMPGYFDEQEEYPLQLGMDNYTAIQDYYENNEDVKSILPRIDYTGLASNGDKTTIFVGLGVSNDEFKVKGPSLEVISGSTLSVRRKFSIDPAVMLAKDLARNLKMNVGDLVTLMSTTTDGALNAIDFEVVGIFTTGVPEMDKRLLYSDIVTTQSLLDSEKISSLSLYLFDHDRTDSYLSDVVTRQNVFVATPWWRHAFYYEKVKTLYNNIFMILGGIIVAMVFVSISNTMNMSVVERTREIGTLAVMGTRKSEIVRNFALEGLILGVLGTTMGTLIAAAISGFLLFVEIRMPPPPGSTMDYPLAVSFSIVPAGSVFLVLTLICVVAAWIAASNSAHKPIVEALTHV